MSKFIRNYSRMYYQPLVYLLGPISRDDYRIYDAFENMERGVNYAGYACFNPLKDGLPMGATDEQHFKKRLNVLIKKARYYCYVSTSVDNGIQSRTFDVERMVIKAIGIPELKISPLGLSLEYRKKNLRGELLSELSTQWAASNCFFLLIIALVLIIVSSLS